MFEFFYIKEVVPLHINKNKYNEVKNEEGNISYILNASYKTVYITIDDNDGKMKSTIYPII